jgi:thioredoxin 1
VEQSKTPTLIEFGATWCLPCKEVRNMIETVAWYNQGTLKVCYADVQLTPMKCLKYQILSVPTLIVFKDGQTRGAVKGVLSGIALGNLISLVL